MNYKAIHQWLLDLCEKSQERGNAEFTQEVLDIKSLLHDDWDNYQNMKQMLKESREEVERLEKIMSEEGYTYTVTTKILGKPVFKHD